MGHNKTVLDQKLDDLRKFIESPFIQVYGEKWDNLTPRQKQLLRFHVYSGQSGKQIAMTFGLAPRTIKNHLHRARQKLGIYGGFGQIKSMLLRNLIGRVVEVLNEIEAGAENEID